VGYCGVGTFPNDHSPIL